VIQPGARAVFLDRDGVLNQAPVLYGKPGSPKTMDEFVIPPDRVVLLKKLKECGFLLIVVTNQPDVTRGRQSIVIIEQMHRKLQSMLPLDDILVCFHDNQDDCPCRKPRPGLLIEAQQRYGLDMTRSFLIGDRWKDVEAGNAAGLKTAFIDYGYRERLPSSDPTVSVASLSEAVEWISAQETDTQGQSVSLVGHFGTQFAGCTERKASVGANRGPA